MNNILSELLLYPHHEGGIDFNGFNTVLFINTVPPLNTPAFEAIKSYNFLYNQKNIWKKRGVENFLLEDDYNAIFDLIFIVLPKQKNEIFYLLSLAIKNLKKEGCVIAVSSNDMGGKNLSKWMHEVGFEGNSFSKKKARIFHGRLKNPDQDKIDQFYKAGIIQQVNSGSLNFFSQPGVFGWNKIDKGSELLIHSMREKELKGTGADFGCGYGYLSQNICNKNPDIKKIYLIDLDQRSLDCAKKNMEQESTKLSLEYIWADLSNDYCLHEKMDWIIMNPPFHDINKSDSSLGNSLIKTAALNLKKQGVLYMVANNHLPYEKTLKTSFKTVEKIIEKNGFKVLKAIA